jgi:hypothetical protein
MRFMHLNWGLVISFGEAEEFNWEFHIWACALAQSSFSVCSKGLSFLSVQRTRDDFSIESLVPWLTITRNKRQGI